MNRKRLTKQQKAFLDDHFMHPEMPQYAVYQRFYKCRENAARANSARLLSSPAAQEYLKRKQAEAKKRTQIEEDEILAQFWNLASFDLADIFTDSWDVRPIHEIPPNARRAITGLLPTAGGGVRITFASRIEALKNVATMLGYYSKKPEENNEASMLRELFSYVQQHGNTGRPGTLKFDPSIAAKSKFDA